ncbi:hypothetical protein JNUCC64_22630 [Streptomyces sp. JNUCC 64]
MTGVTERDLEKVELGRFFRIAGRRFDAGLTAPEMFSGAIDAVWHLLAGDAPEHREFTREHAGRELFHQERSGQGPVTWVREYEEEYGPLPELWFTDVDGTLDTGALARYWRDGTVVAVWDCAPHPGPGDGDDTAPERNDG